MIDREHRRVVDIRYLSKSVRALIAFAAIAFPAFAVEPAPDFVIKADKVEVSITLDAKIKVEPALSSNLLSEGRQWATKEHADGLEARRNESPDLVDWRYWRDYRILSVINNRYVSILTTDSWSMGNGYDIHTILWDRTNGRRISIRPFFRETADGGATLTSIQTAIIATLKTSLEERGQGIFEDRYYKALFEPSLLKIGPVSLAPSTQPGKSSGLIFHYGHSHIGDYSAGLFEPFVPWQTLQPYLTPEGARIFGGSRPKSDEDQPQ